MDMETKHRDRNKQNCDPDSHIVRSDADASWPRHPFRIHALEEDK